MLKKIRTALADALDWLSDVFYNASCRVRPGLPPEEYEELRRDLKDAIYDVSPCETPLLNKMKATARKNEWQTNALGGRDE